MTGDAESPTGGCCAPGPAGIVAVESSGPRLGRTDQRSPVVGELVNITGGSFVMGTDDDYRYPGDGEGPAREVSLGPYRIGKYAVTNRELAAFVAEVRVGR